jgi:hypothetical protein
LGGRGRRISEFEASLVYRVSSRTARATQRNPVSKNLKKKNEKQTKKKNPKNKLSGLLSIQATGSLGIAMPIFLKFKLSSKFFLHYPSW